MRLSKAAFIIPIFVSLACGSSNETPLDAGRDTHITLDGPKDQATPDVAPSDVAADLAPDGAAGDGGADAPIDAPQPPKLVKTVLVIDQLPDGGTDGGPDAMPSIDPNLINPWGLAFNPTGPLWVADNGTGVATVYTSQGQIVPLVVTIPPPTGGTPPSAPTGQVFNPTASFMGDRFIFSTEDGTIAGWQSATTAAVIRAANATSMAIYKGLALGLRNNIPRLYATDFHNARVDVYDAAYSKITTTGGFTDPNLPAGYAPFGVLADGSTILVTYAKQDAMAEDDVHGPGLGYVDMFDFDGVLTRRLISQGALNAPWGLAMAPADFGTLSHTLLVGNFGDGRINAYNPTTGAFVAAAIDSSGLPVVLPGLWALVFGNDTAGAAHNQLFFTAGGAMEDHGVLGRLDFVP